MRRKNAFAILIIVSGLLQSEFFCGNTIGQQQAKPRKKKFGFSLTEKQSKSPPQAKGPKPASNTNQSEGDVQLHTTMAVLDVLITDKDGHFINSIGEIKKEDLIVREDGVEQQVGTFARGDSIEIPKSIILIIDYSGSQFHYLDSSLDAAHTLVTQLGPSDQMAIVTDDVELLCDYTNDKAKLTKALSSIKTKRLNENAGKSLQFSALTAALRELIDADHVRPYIIFQTDGDEIFKLTDQQELRKEYFHDFPYSMMSKIAFKGLIQTIERTPRPFG